MGRAARVLYVNGGCMDYGGISSVMLNYARHMDADAVKIDFLGQGSSYGPRDHEILKMGSRVYHIPAKSQAYMQNVSRMERIIKQGNYDIVHAHADSGNAHILRIAKKCGAVARISHSHNTDYTLTDAGRIRTVVNDLQKLMIPKYATHLWACSKAAGDWLYGGKRKFCTMRNAIEIERYLFSPKSREKIRKQYQIQNRMVIGVVGRLEQRKNHRFLLAMMGKLARQKKPMVLMVVGDGSLSSTFRQYVSAHGLEDFVVFTGSVPNVEEYYSAFDVFVMPSIFEGLPVCAVEAQCNGLPCIFSSNVTDEVDILDTNTFLDIGPGAIGLWADAAIGKAVMGRNLDARKAVEEAGYDITREAGKMQKKYREMVFGRL